MLLPNASSDLFQTHDFQEFNEGANAYFSEIDADEILKGLVREGLDRPMVWHPGGFMVAFATDPDLRAEGQTRIHIWPEDIKRETTDIHKHPWFLAGLVIGEYVEFRPVVTPAVSPETAAWDAINDEHEPGNPDKVHLSLGSPVDVDMGNPHVYKTGEVHVLPDGTYHQTPVRDPLVTIAIMGINRYPASYLRPAGVLVPAIEQPRNQVTTMDRNIALDTIKGITDSILI